MSLDRIFILACLANGYSKAKIKAICHKLQIPFSEEALQNMEELLPEKLDYLKSSPLPDSMFVIFIDAYHTQIREDGKMSDISVFVGVGIDLQGYKHILEISIPSVPNTLRSIARNFLSF